MTQKRDISAGLKEFELLAADLRRLLDDDPRQAIDNARALPAQTKLGGVLLNSLKASILIDAGAEVVDKQAIGEGVLLFREMLAANPTKSDFHYNLGNGLAALADAEPYLGPNWYLATAELRRDARAQFQQSHGSKNSSVCSRALANLGNSFWRAHRWVEAYDAYSKALEQDTTNTIALTGAARILLRCVDRGIGSRKALLSVAARNLKLAKAQPERIQELAGARALKHLKGLLERDLEPVGTLNISHASDYERFIAHHRIALTPTIEGLNCSLKRWDSLRIASYIEPIRTPHGVPPLFAMFNVMKGDFLLARSLAYRAIYDRPEDSGLYSDTLDYALYGIVPSMLTLAQRACVDILDKIAVATSEYFGIPNSEKTTFLSRWFSNVGNRPPQSWHPDLPAQHARPNPAVIALGELSLDMQQGGALHDKKVYRHASTHRFAVLHDLDLRSARRSPLVEHYNLETFQNEVIESLQLVRAALLYFVEMIAIEESKKRSSGMKTFPLDIPSHHWVREGKLENSKAPE